MNEKTNVSMHKMHPRTEPKLLTKRCVLYATKYNAKMSDGDLLFQRRFYIDTFALDLILPMIIFESQSAI